MKGQEIGLGKFQGKIEQWNRWREEWEKATQIVRREAEKKGYNLSKIQLVSGKEG